MPFRCVLFRLVLFVTFMIFLVFGGSSGCVFEYVSLLVVFVCVFIASSPLILRGPLADFPFVYFPVLLID